MPQQVRTGSSTALEAAVSEAAMSAPKGGRTIAMELEERRDAISQALGKVADADYFIRTVVIETQRNPDLLKCTPASLMGAVMTAAQLRLDFGPLGLCYVLPRWSHKKNCYEAQFQMGYRGLINLARRSGDIKDLDAFPVYEKDQFRRWRDEHGEHLLHEQHLGEDRGPIVRYYGHAIFHSGGSVIRVMELSDIARHRAFSESANSKFSPWKTNELSMSLKTCIIAMKAFLPLTPNDAQRLAADEQVIEERGGELIVHNVGPALAEGSPPPEVTEMGEIVDVEVAGDDEWDPEPPEAPAEPTVVDSPPPAQQSLSEDDGGFSGVSDAVLKRVKAGIDTWGSVVCKQKLAEWNQPATGSLDAMRTRLLMVLGPEVAARNPAATDLF